KSIEAVAKKILPAIFARKTENDHVRVWVAGCATGEEAYSLAMILNEVSSHLQKDVPIQLFGTDLDAEAISIAREGFYSEAEVADVSPERLQRFFLRGHDGYRVRR